MELNWREQSLVLRPVKECLALQHISDVFNFNRSDACHHRIFIVSSNFGPTSSLLFCYRLTWLIAIEAVNLRQFTEHRLFSISNTYVWLAMARRHNVLFNFHPMIYFIIIHLFWRRSFRKLLYLVEIVLLFRVFVIICLIKVATRRSAHFVGEKVLGYGQVKLLFAFIWEHTLVMLYLFCGLATLLTRLVIDHINPIVKL